MQTTKHWGSSSQPRAGPTPAAQTVCPLGFGCTLLRTRKENRKHMFDSNVLSPVRSTCAWQRIFHSHRNNVVPLGLPSYQLTCATISEELAVSPDVAVRTVRIHQGPPPQVQRHCLVAWRNLHPEAEGELSEGPLCRAFSSTRWLSLTLLRADSRYGATTTTIVDSGAFGTSLLHHVERPSEVFS